MNIIVDTHVYLWALASPDLIPEEQIEQLSSKANRVYVSAVTVSEIMIKASIGKLTLSFDPLEMIEQCDFERLEYSCEDAAILKELPFHHRDPFDRMLIAQSMNRKYAISTVDSRFRMYDCRLV